MWYSSHVVWMEKPNKGLCNVGVEIKDSKPPHTEIVKEREGKLGSLLISVKCCDVEPSGMSSPSLCADEVVVLKRVMKKYQLKYVERSLINNSIVGIVLFVLSKYCPSASSTLWDHLLPVTIARRGSAGCYGHSAISCCLSS